MLSTMLRARKPDRPPSAPCLGTRPLRVLVFTTVFPSQRRPLHGLFVLERVRHAAGPDADVRVVAPVPRPPWAARPPARALVGRLPVEHPRFVYVPGFLKPLDGVFLFLSALASVRRLRREFDFDLIDAHFAFPDGFAAVLLGRWFRRPVVVTLRGTLIPLSSYPLRRLAAGWGLRRADRVVAVSRALAECAAGLGVPRQRLTVIGNGVDTGRFHPLDRAEARRRLGLPEAGTLLLSAGHLSARKGFDRVVRALPRLLAAHPDLCFVVVGGPGAEGDVGPMLARLAADLGVADHVSLAGARPPEELALWMGAADLFVLASGFEGSPNVVWEALACGCPVVATDVGDLKELMPGHAGIVCGRAEDQAALEAALLDALGQGWDRGRVRAFAAARGWDAVAAEVLKQWRLAIGRREAGAADAEAPLLLGEVLRTASESRPS